VEDFEFLRNVTIGQYLPGDSFVHRLDPRTKMTVMILMVLPITFTLSYLANLLLVLVCLGFVALSGISVKYILSGVKPALGMITILALMQLFFYGDTYVPANMQIVTLFHWGIFHVTNGSVQLVFVSIMRFLSLLFLASLLTNTTTTTGLTHATEDMLRPFAFLKVPAHELSLVLTIALRFVPILAEQLETIMKAQASRGADMGSGGKLQFIQTTRQVVVLVVPLFINAFQRAEDLVLAMESRCYTGSAGRTRLVHLHMTRTDLLTIFVVAVFAVGILIVPFPV